MDWFDLAVQGTLKSLLQPQIQKHQFFLLYYLTKQAWDSHGPTGMGLEPPQMNPLCC